MRCYLERLSLLCILPAFLAGLAEAGTCGNGILEVPEECEPPGTPGCTLACTVEEVRTTPDGIHFEDLTLGPQGEVTLDWAGWQQTYSVFASSDPSNVAVPSNEVGVTSDRTFVVSAGGSGQSGGGFNPGDWIVAGGGVSRLPAGGSALEELFPAEPGTSDRKLDLGDGKLVRLARCRFPETCRLALVTLPDGTTTSTDLPDGANLFDIAAGAGDRFFVLQGLSGGYSVLASDGAGAPELIPFQAGSAASMDFHPTCGEIIVGDNSNAVPALRFFDADTGNSTGSIVLDTVAGSIRDIDMTPGSDGPCVAHVLVDSPSGVPIIYLIEYAAASSAAAKAHSTLGPSHTATPVESGLTGEGSQNGAGLSAGSATSGIVGCTDFVNDEFTGCGWRYESGQSAELIVQEPIASAIWAGGIVPMTIVSSIPDLYFLVHGHDQPSPWDNSWANIFDQQGPACELCRECPPPNESSPMIGDVLVHSGEVAMTLNPSEVSGRGHEAAGRTLTYSNQRDFHSSAGTNWDLEYGTDAITAHVDGGFDCYDAVRGRVDYFGPGDDTAAGLFQVASIFFGGSKAGGVASSSITIRERDGFERTYFSFDGEPAAGRLQRIEDRNGNLLEFNYNDFGQLIEAVDSMGRSVRYEYDSRGRVTRIVDFDLRETILQFDDLDNLISITTPAVRRTPHDDDGIAFNGPDGNDFPRGKTTRFRYDSLNPDPLLRNNLLAVTFPDEVVTGGPERITYEYGTDPADSSTYDRVIRMEVGGGQGKVDPVGGGAIDVPAGGAYTFAYEDLAPRDESDLVTEFRKTTVTDPNGNVTEYFFNSTFHEVRRVVHTNRDVNSQDPATFTTTKTWASDCRLTQVTYPGGNRTLLEYDFDNPSRFSQGNVLRITEIADPERGGDQAQLETTFTYDPIYNRVLTTTGPRGNDANFGPPIPDDPSRVHAVDFNLDGDVNDPADGETTRRYRYTTSRTLDYMEMSPAEIEALAAAERVELDPDGAGPRTAAQVAQALSLGVDLNGDRRTDMSGGNVIEVRAPTVQSKTAGGVAPQEIVYTHTYNDLGQITSSADPEGNLASHYYYPETDPDGDGLSVGLVRPDVNTVTGGYKRLVVLDDDPVAAADPGGSPLRPAGQPIQNAGTARRARPAPFAEASTGYAWDRVGNLIRSTDGRGIETHFEVNELNQVVQITRAAAHRPLAQDPTEPQALTDFQYKERLFYDFNDNLIRRQIEDRGDTSSVGSDNPGGHAFVDMFFKYDLLDQLIEAGNEVEDGETLVTRRRYDPNGNLALVIKPEGNAESFAYDERDLLFRSVRGAATPPPMALLGTGDPVAYQVRGGTPSTRTFSYDANANPVEIADADDTDGSPNNNSPIAGAGDRSRRIFDGFDRMTGVVDSVGNQSVAQFDPAGNRVRVSRFGPDGGTSPTTDGPDTLPLPVSDAGTIQSFNLVDSNLLAATEFDHDEISRPFQVDRVLFANTDPTADIADGALDIGKEDLTPADDQAIPGVAGITIRGRVSELLEYDRNSRVVSLAEDDGDTHNRIFDGLDRLIETVDPEANRLAIAYDDSNNVIETQEVDVSQIPGVPDEMFLTTYFHDALNRLRQRVDNVGQFTAYRYDSRNNLVAVADAKGPMTGNSIGRRHFASGASTINDVNDFGNVRLFSYDGINRRTLEQTILTPSGQGDGASIGADVFGIETSPPAPDTSQAGGDGMITIRREWDRNSLLSGVTDDNGNRTSFGYDDLDRRIARTRGECAPPGLADRCDPPTTTLWDYDPDHNVAFLTDENGSVRTCQYDAINRRVGCSIARGAGVVGTTATSYLYDGLSRAVQGTDDNDPANPDDDSEIGFDYDSLGRVIQERQRIGNLPERIISSSWRAEALRSGLAYPSGRNLDFGYDLLDRPRTIADNGVTPAIAEYDYLGPARVSQRLYPQNGTRMSFLNDAGNADVGYDGLRRPVQLRDLDTNDALVVGFEHAYDRMSQRLNQLKLHDPDNDEAYAYDSAYRLKSFDRPAVSAIAPQQSSWAIDGVGNWEQVDAETRQHTSFNEIVERDNGGSPTVLLSDDNGNLTDDGALTYEWDYSNRLRRATRKSDDQVIVEYAYDAGARRVRKVVTNSGALNGATDFYYDGWQVIEERDDADIVTQQYVYGRGIDEPLVMDRNLNADSDTTGPGDQRLFFHQDAQGSVFALTDDGANVVEGYQYDAYGAPTVFTPGANATVDSGLDDGVLINGGSLVGNPYLFTARRLDLETRVPGMDGGLYYYRNRYFSPELGRFLQRDPVWDPANLENSYAFVGNGPVNRVDRFGLFGYAEIAAFMFPVELLALDWDPTDEKSSSNCEGGSHVPATGRGLQTAAQDVCAVISEWWQYTTGDRARQRARIVKERGLQEIPPAVLTEIRQATAQESWDAGAALSGNPGNIVNFITLGQVGHGCGSWRQWMNTYINLEAEQFRPFAYNFARIYMTSEKWGLGLHRIIRFQLVGGGDWYVMDPWTDSANPVWREDIYKAEQEANIYDESGNIISIRPWVADDGTIYNPTPP